MDPLSSLQQGLTSRFRELQDRIRGDRIGDVAKSGPQATGAGEGLGESPFAKMLGDGIREVAALQQDAREKTRGLVTGETKNLHEVMIAGEKAGVAFNLMLEIRNKLVQTWREVTRIQV